MNNSGHDQQSVRSLLVLNILVWVGVLVLGIYLNEPLITLAGILPGGGVEGENGAGTPNSNVAAVPTTADQQDVGSVADTMTPSPLPSATPVASATPDEEPSKSGLATHLVRPGDTLYGIARTYQVDVNQLIELNRIRNPNFINSGQEIVLPATETPPAVTTPTSPSQPTVTPTVAGTPTPEPTATLEPVWPFGPYTGQNPLPIPPNTISVLLLGAEGTTHWRTDSIMLVVLNPDTNRAGILSLPRDLWVAIPGYGYNRINTVDFTAERSDYPGGGPALLRRVLRENLGLSFDHYARVNFHGFIQIIDTLGGVDVVVDCAIEDIFPHPTKPGELLHMDLQPGLAHMDGAMALSYSRSRLSTSDFDRAHRQQSVIEGLWRKGKQLDIIPRIPQLYQDLNEAFVTDMTPDKVVQLARVGLKVEPQNVQALVVDRTLTRGWMTPEGAAVLLPEQEKIEAALTEFFTELGRPPNQVAAEDITVRIQNQTSYDNWSAVAATRVEWAGGIVSDVVTNPQQNSQTAIHVYREQTETLNSLVEATRLDPSRVERREAAPDSPDLELIVGYDFAVCIR